MEEHIVMEIVVLLIKCRNEAVMQRGIVQLAERCPKISTFATLGVLSYVIQIRNDVKVQ